MTNLTDFLLARIAEDEENPPDTDKWAGYVEGLSSEDWARINSEQARWEQRWAAECAAKRRIIELKADWRYQSSGVVMDVLISQDEIDGRREMHAEVLRLLAQPYADHPDFREEWRL